MTTYLFFEQLFKNVLAVSTVLQGRLAVCPRHGSEINTDNVGAIIEDLVLGQTNWKWPGVLLMPPISEMTLAGDLGEWERYRIELWFLATTFYTGDNQVKFPNPNTQTSTHRIIEDWHDMKRCAIDFVRALQYLQSANTPAALPFRVSSEKKYFDPLSLQGNKRLSGVRLTFKADVWVGCEAEDYEPEALTTIAIPDFNIHPSHLH